MLKAWRTNANTKIKIKEKRDSAFKTLQALLYELDTDTFHKMLHEVLRRFHGDEETHLFYKYFKQQYINKEKYRSWAYCYRVHLGINTNMAVENFNKILKYFYLKGKHIKRLDKTICAILHLLKDKMFDLIIKMKKGKLVKKLQVLRTRHKASMLLDAETVLTTLDDKWQVLSSTQTEFYTVKRIQHCKSCLLQCIHCNSCFHEFVCSCMDSAIRNNMCKHIHLVCRTLTNMIPENMNMNEEHMLIIDLPKDGDTMLEEAVINEASRPNSKNTEKSISINSEKKKLFEQFQEIQQNLETVEQCQYAKKQMEQLLLTIKAMKSSAERSLKVCIIFSQIIHFIL